MTGGISEDSQRDDAGIGNTGVYVYAVTFKKGMGNRRV